MVLAAAAAGTIVAAPTASAVPTATVAVTTQRMSAPTLKSRQVGTYTAKRQLSLTCYVRGQSVKGHYSQYIPGGWDNIWYAASDGYWVADVDINTRSNKPIAPYCKTARAAVTTQRMSGPSLKTSQSGTYSAGRTLALSCYERGQSVKGYYSRYIPGGWDNLWYRVNDGRWVADVDINTGSNKPVTGACRPQLASGTLTAKINAFVSNNTGRVLANASGTYPGECVSLVSQYLLQVHGVRTGAWGNAVDYRAGGTGGSRMASLGFAWHTDRSFRNGDILVWGAGTQTEAVGYIAVYYNGKIFDQNHGARRSAALAGNFSSGYIGYWRK